MCSCFADHFCLYVLFTFDDRRSPPNVDFVLALRAALCENSTCSAGRALSWCTRSTTGTLLTVSATTTNKLCVSKIQNQFQSFLSEINAILKPNAESTKMVRTSIPTAAGLSDISDTVFPHLFIPPWLECSKRVASL